MTAASRRAWYLLPFRLNVCAVGDRVEPLRANIDGASGHDQRSAFDDRRGDGPQHLSGWLGLVGGGPTLCGRSRRRSPICGVGDSMDEREMRSSLLDAAQTAVRRVLNAYRWRLHQPEVHAVQIDPAQFAFALMHTDGSRNRCPSRWNRFSFTAPPPSRR